MLVSGEQYCILCWVDVYSLFRYVLRVTPCWVIITKTNVLQSLRRRLNVTLGIAIASANTISSWIRRLKESVSILRKCGYAYFENISFTIQHRVETPTYMTKIEYSFRLTYTISCLYRFKTIQSALHHPVMNGNFVYKLFKGFTDK